MKYEAYQPAFVLPETEPQKRGELVKMKLTLWVKSRHKATKHVSCAQFKDRWLSNNEIGFKAQKEVVP